MRRLCAAACLLSALGVTGCTGRLMWVPNADSCAPANAVTIPAESSMERSIANHVGVPSCTSEGCPKETPLPRRTVFVKGPQQKIIIERECEKPKKEAAPKAPAAPLRQPEAVPTVSQDVMLVPRTVYVPYVAQTPTRAARLVTPVGAVQDLAAEQTPQSTPKQDAPKQDMPKKEDAPKTTFAAPTTTCPADDCAPTTVIEIRQMNERIDRLHRILERLCAPGERR